MRRGARACARVGRGLSRGEGAADRLRHPLRLPRPPRATRPVALVDEYSALAIAHVDHLHGIDDDGQRPVPGAYFGAIFGVSQIGSALGTALGPWLAGWTFDVTGSYAMPFTLAAVTAGAAAIAVTLSRCFPAPRRP